MAMDLAISLETSNMFWTNSLNRTSEPDFELINNPAASIQRLVSSGVVVSLIAC
jgi:hypothetical protein